MERNQVPMKVGMRVRIRLLEDGAGTSQYGTRIQDLSDNTVTVQRPTDQYRPVQFRPGARVELSVIVTDMPGKEGQYRGECVVLRELVEPVPLLRLELPQKWHRSQLREYFRVPVTLRVKVRVEPEDGSEEAAGEWTVGWMRDISGGGLQMLLPLELAREDRVTVEFTLQDETLRIPAVVTRSVPDEDAEGPGDQYVVGVEFTDISEQERTHIIRFTFQRQIELRKKGMA